MTIKRMSRRKVDLSKVDWARVDATTDEEIRGQIATDPDSADEFGSFKKARVVRAVPIPDVRAIRTRQNLTQQEFAVAYGFSERTLQGWE